MRWEHIGAGLMNAGFHPLLKADNGPLTPDDEGLSYIYVDGQKVTLRDAMGVMGAEFLGQEAINEYGGWVMYSKFFDNMYPLPHHVHQNDEYAAHVGR